jgi:hypothetical protein
MYYSLAGLPPKSLQFNACKKDLMISVSRYLSRYLPMLFASSRTSPLRES